MACKEPYASSRRKAKPGITSFAKLSVMVSGFIQLHSDSNSPGNTKYRVFFQDSPLGPKDRFLSFTATVFGERKLAGGAMLRRNERNRWDDTEGL